MTLTPHTVLQRAANLRLTADSSNELTIMTPSGSVRCGPQGMLALEVFAQPRTLAEGLNALRPFAAGLVDWINTTTAVTQLYETGILRAEVAPPPQPEAAIYSSAAAEIALLANHPLLSTMLNAIRELVRPDDVVVEIGAGVGLRAIAAAQAGARHVYAVETGELGGLIPALAEANGLADRVTHIADWGAGASLPERASVLVLGDALLGSPSAESLTLIADLRNRALTPDARILPERVDLYALPVFVPADALDGQTFTPAVVARWREWYGLDFTPLADAASESGLVFDVSAGETLAWQQFGSPLRVASTTLCEAAAVPALTVTPFVSTAVGVLNGVLLYSEIQLAPRRLWSERPASKEGAADGRCTVWVLATPLEVRSGERLILRYSAESAAGTSCVEVLQTEVDDAVS